VRLHRLHAEQLAGEALAGHGDHIAELAVPADVPPALLETLADLAVRPLLVAMAERLGPGLTLRPWERGFCPICGAWPLYAERATDTSSLRCSRCLTCWAWDLPRCPHCQKSRLASLNTLAASDLGLWSVDGCDTCGRYLKISGAARSGRLASVLLVDLETWALDRAALAQGLGRPEGVGYRLELADEDEELDDD
jgi:FdhE protein